jgi:hypothetical protein
MAENGEKRSPTSHRTPGQTRRMDRTYNARPENIAKRSKNNQARAEMEKAGKVHKGDGKDVDHIKPLRSGGSNTKGNLRAIPKGRNRGWRDGV